MTCVYCFYRHGAEVVADDDVAGPTQKHHPAFKGAGMKRLKVNFEILLWPDQFIKNSHLVVKHAGYRLGATAGEGSQPLPNTVSSTNRSSPPQQVRMDIYYIMIITIAVQKKINSTY